MVDFGPGVEWTPDKCPNCGTGRVRPMSAVAGNLHYRCPECLWSWRRAHIGLRLPCHGDLAPGQECSTCGAFLPLEQKKGEPS